MFQISGIDINQDEICHATSNSFHGSIVQTNDVMSKKTLLDASTEIVVSDGENQIWIGSVYLGAMRVKRKRETDGIPRA